MASPTLKAKFDLDGSSFKRSMDDIKSSAKKSVKEIESLGGGSGGGVLMRALGVVGALVSIGKVGDAIDALIAKMKKLRDDVNQTGLDAETLQKIGNIGSVEAATKGLESLAEAQAKILSGGDNDLKLTKAFANLGVSLDDLKNKRHQDIFLQIADAMKNAEASAQNINDLSAVMGGKGPDLLPMFRKGLDSPQAGAGVVSNADVEEINRLSDEADKATAPLRSFWEELKMQAGRLWLNVKKGTGQVVTEAPDIIQMKTADESEIRGERIRRQGSERLRQRDIQRAQEQAAMEEARIAREEAAAKRAELMQKALQVQGKEREKALQTHIKGLENARGKVGQDLDAIRNGNNVNVKGVDSANLGRELIIINRVIVEELRKANQTLSDTKRNGRPVESELF